jgi:uncharacterized coiled-coil protein SlyX
LYHIAIEVIAIVSICLYYNSKIFKLNQHIEDLSDRLDEQETQLIKSNKTINEFSNIINGNKTAITLLINEIEMLKSRVIEKEIVEKPKKENSPSQENIDKIPKEEHVQESFPSVKSLIEKIQKEISPKQEEVKINLNSPIWNGVQRQEYSSQEGSTNLRSSQNGSSSLHSTQNGSSSVNSTQTFPQQDHSRFVEQLSAIQVPILAFGRTPVFHHDTTNLAQIEEIEEKDETEEDLNKEIQAELNDLNETK